MFFTGVSPPVFRWEVSYKRKSFQKNWNFGPTQNFVKCPKLVREPARAIQKIKKNEPKRALGPNLGPGPCGARRQEPKALGYY